MTTKTADDCFDAFDHGIRKLFKVAYSIVTAIMRFSAGTYPTSLGLTLTFKETSMTGIV